MIIAIICYFISCIITLLILNKRKIKFNKFPKLYLKKFGLVFVSHKTHRLNIKDCKTMQVEKVVYIKKNNQLVIITNVDNIIKSGDYMYFSALGKVKIIFNCISFYKYFNLNIISKKMDINVLKQLALLDILNNIYNLNQAQKLKKYMFIIKKILNIEINKEKITIKRNKLKIPYVLTYKVNNIIKRINIKETF